MADWIEAVQSGLTKAGFPNNLTTDAGRNLALSYSEAAVMARYAALREKLLTSRAATKVIFDVVDLGLTAAVPISNGQRGKTILGSLATGFKGTNLSVDRNVFNEQSSAAILSAMDTCVIRMRGHLAEKSALPSSRYTIFTGYADLSRLYGCTTLAGALQELSENQAIALRQEQQGERTVVLAAVTAENVASLQAVQAAFQASMNGDKTKALAFLKTLGKAEGLSENSAPDALITEYRNLASVLGDSEKVNQFIDAARSSGLLAAGSN